MHMLTLTSAFLTPMKTFPSPQNVFCTSPNYFSAAARKYKWDPFLFSLCSTQERHRARSQFSKQQRYHAAVNIYFFVVLIKRNESLSKESTSWRKFSTRFLTENKKKLSMRKVRNDSPTIVTPHIQEMSFKIEMNFTSLAIHNSTNCDELVSVRCSACQETFTSRNFLKRKGVYLTKWRRG